MLLDCGCSVFCLVNWDWSRHVTFICGRAGVCALGAVVAKNVGDEALLNHYLSSFREVTLGYVLIFSLLRA